jgi:cephalosporin hydroxylase
VEDASTIWGKKMRAAFLDTYAGIPLCKLPEDLRTYEHLIWESAPQVVIELGGYRGGSALWFRDRLRALESYGRVTDPYVVTVEIDPSRIVLPDSSSIEIVAGDVCAPATVERVRALVPPGTNVMVVEDSAHTYETTYAALDHFSDFVRPGGFFVVEDGVVDIDEYRIDDAWPRGVLPALRDWLPGKPFTIREDVVQYGFTCNPGGILQRDGD